MKKSCQFYNLLFYNNQDNSCCTILIRDNVKRTDMGRYFGASQAHRITRAFLTQTLMLKQS